MQLLRWAGFGPKSFKRIGERKIMEDLQWRAEGKFHSRRNLAALTGLIVFMSQIDRERAAVRPLWSDESLCEIRRLQNWSDRGPRSPVRPTVSFDRHSFEEQNRLLHLHRLHQAIAVTRKRNDVFDWR